MGVLPLSAPRPPPAPLPVSPQASLQLADQCHGAGAGLQWPDHHCAQPVRNLCEWLDCSTASCWVCGWSWVGHPGCVCLQPLWAGRRGGGGMDSKARGRAAWAQKACVPAVALHQMHTTWFWSGYCECGTKAETHVRHSLHSRPRTHRAMCVCGCSPTAGKHCTLCPLQRTWVPHPALAVCRLLQNGCTRDRSRVRSIFPSLGNQVAKFIASKRQRCQYTGSSIPS